MPETPSAPERPTLAVRWSRLGAVLGALVLVAAAVWLSHRLGETLPAAYAVSIFLVAVLAGAALFGPGPGLAAALASFLAFDFLFVQPTGTFSVDDPREVFALGVFLVAAILTGSLAGRMREAVDAARRRADTLAMLKDFAERVGATTDREAIRSLAVRRIFDLTGTDVVLFDRRGASEFDLDAWPNPVTPDEGESAAVRAIFAEPAPRPRGAGRFLLRPLATVDGCVAVVGLATPVADDAFAAENGLAALLDQAATALDRARFAEERAAAAADAERERLRSALLASISHDLRTPLATILGSVTSLRQLGDRMAPEERADLLAAIEEETDRLSRLVADLLLMTRLEAGLDVRRDRIDPVDVVAAAADHLRRVHPGRVFRVAPARDVPPVRGDATLLEQVVFNLGDNAVKASPTTAPIDLAVGGDAAGVAVSVTDGGRGLGPDEIERLFGERPHPNPRVDARGGLGLVIATRVVAAMGGRLGAESRTPEVPGTRVTLHLPADPPDEKEPEDP